MVLWSPYNGENIHISVRPFFHVPVVGVLGVPRPVQDVGEPVPQVGQVRFGGVFGRSAAEHRGLWRFAQMIEHVSLGVPVQRLTFGRPLADGRPERRGRDDERDEPAKPARKQHGGATATGGR